MLTQDPTPASDPLLHAYNAAAFLARDGDYDLALAILRKGLEKAHLDRAGRRVDVADDAARADIERKLEAEYAACRLKIEERRRPWKETLAKTAIVTGGVAITFILCFGFAVWRLDALIASPVDKVVAVVDREVSAEVPKVTNRVLDAVPQMSAQVDREMQAMSLRMNAYLEKKIDSALDERIRAIVDEKLDARRRSNK